MYESMYACLYAYICTYVFIRVCEILCVHIFIYACIALNAKERETERARKRKMGR